MKKIFITILLCIISCSIGIGAATVYQANQVKYKDSNVEAALDELYLKNDKQSKKDVFHWSLYSNVGGWFTHFITKDNDINNLLDYNSAFISTFENTEHSVTVDGITMTTSPTSIVNTLRFNVAGTIYPDGLSGSGYHIEANEKYTVNQSTTTVYKGTGIFIPD